MNKDKVKKFYDDFLKSKMLEYRISGNPRIERATERALGYVDSDSNVVDVGCGIGITAERVAGEVNEGHVWAFDISERNIWYARETVDCSNITFFSADVSDNKQKILDYLSGTVDVVILVDVIEHIPKSDHSDLFDFFQSITSNRAFVILTYPSPQYQKYLKESDPGELQIIDRIIERDELMEAAEPYGFSLQHYSLETIWKRNQYVHCVLQTDASLGEPHSEEPGVLGRIRNRIQATWKHRVLKPVRRWKYVDSVFS